MMHISPTLNPIDFIKAVFGSSKEYHYKLKQFSYARGALIVAINSIKSAHGLNQNTTVFVPAFICDTVIDLFKAYDIPYVYYHVTKDLKVDWKRFPLDYALTDSIFLIVNYYGFPMCDNQTVEFTKENKMFLIEDYAHSILNVNKNIEDIIKGDAAIFGFRKILPLPHGGALFLKNIPLLFPKKKFNNKGEYRGVFKMIVQWFLIKSNIDFSKRVKVGKNSVGKHPHNYYYFDYLLEMSRFSKKILNAINIDDISKIRRSNYQYLDSRISNLSGVHVPKYFSLQSEFTVPWVYYFFLKESQGLIKELSNNKISSSYFPELHSDIFLNKKYSLENEMMRDAVILPIHQDISINDLDKMIKIINKYIRR
jgi:dTDP-4-amino-4,6-dideoxygalactose transaminase